jgi:hypothetical protein
MRLTLRTLLAWLDGVLPEGEQLEIGAKVSASAAATPLVERIRAAVGRAAVGAPRLDARGLADDPNSVAEYLDNTLPKDQLEGFERICIESEMHLAEVAACHALLAEAARDSARAQHLDAAGRQRLGERLRGMLAGLQDRAVTDAAAAQAAEATDELRDTARAIRAAIDGSPGGGVVMGPAASRPAPRRSSAAAWASAGLAIVLLLALATALAWTLGRGGRREAAPATAAPEREPDQPLAVAPAPVAPAAAPEPAAPPADAASVAKPASAPAAAASEGVPAGPVDAPGASAGQPAAITASPSRPQPEEGQAPPPGPRMAATEGAGTEPAAGPTAAAADAATPGAVAPPAAVAAAPPPGPPGQALPADPVGFVGGEGVLLRLAPDASGAEPRWTHFPAGSQLAVGEQFLVPPLSQCDLHVRGVKIRLLPETRVGLALDADGTPRLELAFGRAVVRSSRADARMGITAAGLVGTIDAGLVEPVAAEVRLDRPLGDDPATVPPQVTARIGAGPRGIVWRQTMPDGRPAEPPLEGIAAQGLLDAGTALEWTSTAPDRITVDRRAGQPPWVEVGLRLDRTDKSAGEALAAKVAATTPLDRALKELAADRRRVENRMIAAATLALLGDYDELVEQLSADAPGRKLEAGKWSALEAASVPLALSRGGNAASRLYGAFVNRGPHGKADLLWRLARGVTDDELAAGVDRQLVDALEDSDLIVRRYAIKVLCDVTRAGAADRNRYRADGLPDMRREGVDWWRKQLQRGLIRRTANGRLDQADAAEAAAVAPERTEPPPEDDGDEDRLLPAGRED